MNLLNPPYEYLSDPNDGEKINQACTELAAEEVLAVDTETTGLNPYESRVRLLQIGNQEKVYLFDCFALGWDGKQNPMPEKLVEILESPTLLKVLHNAKFDWTMCEVRLGVEMDAVFDTFVASKILSLRPRESNGLAAVLKRELDIELSKEMQRSNWGAEVLTPEQLQYAANDVLVLHPLRDRLKKRLMDEGLAQIARIEFFALPAVSKMETNGIYVDQEKWRTILERISHEKEHFEKKLIPYFPAPQMDLFGEKQVGLNLNSNVQIKNVLEKLLDEELEDVSEKTLMSLSDRLPVAEWIVGFRHREKMLSTFGEKFLSFIQKETNRAHPDYFQIASPSGRMACGKPNIMTVPKSFGFRTAVRPPTGKAFIICDYSQIELRVAAVIAQEQVMLEAYRQEQDLHALTASRISGKPINDISKEERQAAKAINFGFLFGMGAERFRAYASDEYGIHLTQEQAFEYRNKFFQSYPGLERWHKESPDKANQDREIRTISGRRVSIPEGEQWFTGALNIPVQGTAADGIKMAMGRIHRRLHGTDVHMVAMIHDELIFEAPDDSKLEEVKSCIVFEMEKAMLEILGNQVPVTAEAEIGYSWQEK